MKRSELDALAADVIRKQTVRIDQLEDLLKRSDPDAIPRLTNTPEADIARAPEFSMAIADRIEKSRKTGASPGLFDAALTKAREETIKKGGKGIDGTIRRSVEKIDRERANVETFRKNRRS